MGDFKFAAAFRTAERPGAYCRVIVPGNVQAGDDVSLEPFPGASITVLEMFREHYRRNKDETALESTPCALPSQFVPVTPFKKSWIGCIRLQPLEAGAMPTLKRARHPMPAFVREALVARGLMGVPTAVVHLTSGMTMWVGSCEPGCSTTRQRRLLRMLDELEGGGLYMNMPLERFQPSVSHGLARRAGDMRLSFAMSAGQLGASSGQGIPIE